jgi:hypothetical protein
MPRGEAADKVVETLTPVAAAVFLPLFFTYSGLRTEFGLLGDPAVLLFAVACVALAIAGKFGACWAAARLRGEPQPVALRVGALMNARGLMQLIALNVGLEAGIVNSSLFTVLVLVALVTTLMTTPLLSPPGELGAVAGLGHRLAGGHVEVRVEPEHRRRQVRVGRRFGVVEVGAGDLEPGQVLGPAVERDGREDPYLRRLPGHRDARQRLGPPPLGPARPPDHLPDPRVLPVPHDLRPLPVTDGPLIAEDRQHGPGRGLQRVRTSRGSIPLDPHNQGQHELRSLVTRGGLVEEGVDIAAGNDGITGHTL